MGEGQGKKKRKRRKKKKKKHEKTQLVKDQGSPKKIKDPTGKGPGQSTKKTKKTEK